MDSVPSWFELIVAESAREDLLLLDVLFCYDQIVCQEATNLFDSVPINVHGLVRMET